MAASVVEGYRRAVLALYSLHVGVEHLYLFGGWAALLRPFPCIRNMFNSLFCLVAQLGERNLGHLASFEICLLQIVLVWTQNLLRTLWRLLLQDG